MVIIDAFARSVNEKNSKKRALKPFCAGGSFLFAHFH
jgi:hypothetical protein